MLQLYNQPDESYKKTLNCTIRHFKPILGVIDPRTEIELGKTGQKMLPIYEFRTEIQDLMGSFDPPLTLRDPEKTIIRFT